MLDVATGGKVAMAVVAILASLVGIALAVRVYLQKRMKPVEPEILAEGWRYDSTITAFVGGPGEQAFEAIADLRRLGHRRSRQRRRPAPCAAAAGASACSRPASCAATPSAWPSASVALLVYFLTRSGF